MAHTTSRPTSSAPSSSGCYEDHYRPVTASAFVTGEIDLPRGATPVVLTFDDSTTSQAALLPDGRIDPDSAVGIMLEFARDHPDFRPAGTFYLNRAPFGADPRAGQLATRLLALGFELGNHTLDHVRLDELDDDGVQRQIVLGNRLIRALAPDAEIDDDRASLRSLAEPARARSARVVGRRGATTSPARSSQAPSRRRRRSAGASIRRQIPRIRTDPGDLLNGSSDWLRRLEASPELRYVSDGEADHHPVALASQLARSPRRGRG